MAPFPLLVCFCLARPSSARRLLLSSSRPASPSASWARGCCNLIHRCELGASAVRRGFWRPSRCFGLCPGRRR
eukprot:2074005-Pyramimonas_sp.AAC.1